MMNKGGVTEINSTNLNESNNFFPCTSCQKTFNRKGNLNRHMKAHDLTNTEMNCNICQKIFNHKEKLHQHMKTHEEIVCTLCHKKFMRKSNLNYHLKVKDCIRKKECGTNNKEREVKQTRKNSKSVLGVFNVDDIFPSAEAGFDLNVFLFEISPKVKSILQEGVENERAIKWYINVAAVMIRTTYGEEKDIITPHFRSQVYTDLTADFLQDHIEESKEKILKSFEEFTQRGSGWTLLNINKLEVFVAKYSPLAS